jgi:hypothetical protein
MPIQNAELSIQGPAKKLKLSLQSQFKMLIFSTQSQVGQNAIITFKMPSISKVKC